MGADDHPLDVDLMADFVNTLGGCYDDFLDEHPTLGADDVVTSVAIFFELVLGKIADDLELSPQGRRRFMRGAAQHFARTIDTAPDPPVP